MRNGPLYVRGPVRPAGPEGTVLTETRVALCRCGATSNPPLCDNSHRAIGFRAPDGPPEERHSPALSPAEICEQQDF